MPKRATVYIDEVSEMLLSEMNLGECRSLSAFLQKLIKEEGKRQGYEIVPAHVRKREKV